jgi:cystathionine beta-lyase/cystathionine gamma-synthase
MGADVVAEILQTTIDNITEQALAELGDLLTPEHALEEIRFAEVLDLRIERAHDRLMKVQDRRAKKAAVNVVTLQPGWATRKR